MKRKKKTNEKPRNDPNTQLSEISRAARKSGRPFVPICLEDGRVVGSITDAEMCKTKATRQIDFQLITVPSVSSERIIPCMTNEKLRDALKSALALQEIQVAGGIVRHGIR